MASIAMLNFSETICFLKLGHTIFLRHWFFKEGLSPVPGSIRRQRSEGWRPKTSAELFSRRSHVNGSANPSWYSTCQRADYLCNKRTCFVSHTLSNDLTIVYLEKPTDSRYFPTIWLLKWVNFQDCLRRFPPVPLGCASQCGNPIGNWATTWFVTWF